MDDLFSNIDFTVNDYPVYDPDCALTHFPFHFMSSGQPVHAFMWVAATQEPRGTVIVAPQKNGGDSYESLITPLISSGIHVMKIHPRGMWDSVPASNSPMKTVDDIHAAVDWLRATNGEHTAYALKERTFRVDLDRIGIVGKSGGGGTAGLVATAENPHLNSVVALAPVNMELYRGMPDMVNHGIGGESEKATLASYERDKVLTAGRVDHAFAIGAMTPDDFDRVSIVKRAVDLVGKNVLLIGGAVDAAQTAKNHDPFVAAMRTAGARNFTDVLLQADTYFLTARIALARLVIAWLRKQGF